MKFELEYRVAAHGWADATVSNGNESFDAQVSYLHDSLSELAKMAIDIARGVSESKVIFMDEPGELHLLVRQENEKAYFEARWYEGWPSWGMSSEEEFEVKVSGECSSKEVVEQIKIILENIYQDLGPKEYKKRWVEHEFPMELFTDLLGLQP